MRESKIGGMGHACEFETSLMLAIRSDIVHMDRAVTNEDRPILEGIQADFPLQTTTEVHTRSDRMTVEYRRLLGELASESGLPVRAARLWSRTA